MTRTGARQADLEDPDDAVVADRISKVVLNLGAPPPPPPPPATTPPRLPAHTHPPGCAHARVPIRSRPQARAHERARPREGGGSGGRGVA